MGSRKMPEFHGPVAVHSCSHSWQIYRSCPPTEANNEQEGREPSDRGGGPDHWAAGDGRTSARAHTKRSPHSFPTDPHGQIHTERAQQGIFQPSPWRFDGSLDLHPPQGCLSNSVFLAAISLHLHDSSSFITLPSGLPLLWNVPGGDGEPFLAGSQPFFSGRLFPCQGCLRQEWDTTQPFRDTWMRSLANTIWFAGRLDG